MFRGGARREGLDSQCFWNCFRTSDSGDLFVYKVPVTELRKARHHRMLAATVSAGCEVHTSGPTTTGFF